MKAHGLFHWHQHYLKAHRVLTEPVSVSSWITQKVSEGHAQQNLHVGVCEEHCPTLPWSFRPEEPPSVLVLYFPLVHTAFSFSAVSLPQHKVVVMASQGFGSLQLGLEVHWNLIHHKSMCCAPGNLLCVLENISKPLEKPEHSQKRCRKKLSWGRIWVLAHQSWEQDKFSLKH